MKPVSLASLLMATSFIGCIDMGLRNKSIHKVIPLNDVIRDHLNKLLEDQGFHYGSESDWFYDPKKGVVVFLMKGFVNEL